MPAEYLIVAYAMVVLIGCILKKINVVLKEIYKTLQLIEQIWRKIRAGGK